MQKLLLILFCLSLNWINTVYAFDDIQPGTRLYKEYAPLVGTWTGPYKGKRMALVMWPYRNYRSLTGVLQWGKCTYPVNIEYFSDTIDDYVHLRKTTPVYQSIPYLYSVKTILRISDTTRSNGFDNRKCEDKRYRYQWPFNLSAERGFTELYIYDGDKKSPAALTRVKPDSQLVGAINSLQKFNKYKLTANARIAVCEPTINYQALTSAKPNKASKKTNCLSGAQKNKKQASVLQTKNQSYWLDNYDTLGKLYWYIYSGDFKQARFSRNYYGGYNWFITGYSEKCKDNMQTEKTLLEIGWHTHVTDQYGSYNKDYYKKYVTLPSRHKSTYLRVHEKGNGIDMTGSQVDVSNLIRFEGCNGPVTLKLLENYYRSMNNMSPL
jgi:hypothetical protein